MAYLGMHSGCVVACLGMHSAHSQPMSRGTCARAQARPCRAPVLSAGAHS